MINSKKSGLLSWLSNKIKKKKKINIDKDNDRIDSKLIIDDKFSSTKKYQDDKKLIISNRELIDSQDDIAENQKITMDKIDLVVKKNVVKTSLFFKLKNSLTKTKNFFNNNIISIFRSHKIDNVLFEKLEEKMLLADIGIETTDYIITHLKKECVYKKIHDPNRVYHLLQKTLFSILYCVEVPLKIQQKKPFIILIVGVNGSGKTTTAVKLAKKYKLEGKSVVLAAGDTFRAAGIEQLCKLGELHNIPVITNSSTIDPAAVVFDAVNISISKKHDVLIVDTAGRLHNKTHLIEELKKIVRVIKKIDISAPQEIILVVDACNGQNTLKQMEIFHDALKVTGIIITKLDGTAKGGVIFSLAKNFSIPIRYIGIGEKMTDLQDFHSQDFINAIFN